MKVTEIKELEDGGAELTVEMNAEEHDEIFEFGFNEALRGGLEIIKEAEPDLSEYDLEELLNMVEGGFYLSFALEEGEWVLENRDGKTFYSPDPKEVAINAIYWQKNRR